MKRTSTIILIAGITVGMAACSKSLDKLPLDSPSSETFYKNATEVEMGIQGCYKSLNWELKATRPWPVMLDNTTDISWNRSAHAVQELGNGTAISTNSSAEIAWTQCYKSIGRANFLLDNIDRATDLSDDYKKQVIAEARWVRSFNYFLLTELFGAVPLVTNSIKLEEAQLERTSKTEVANFILKEMDEAAPDLPAANVGKTGRATRVAAYALKARVALFNRQWQVAADAANAARAIGKYGLYENYGNLFNYTGETSKEHIFSLQYMKGIITHSNSNFLSSRLAGGVANEVPTQQMVDSYECTDGLTIDKSPLYNPSKPFANRDPRLAMSIALPGSVYYGFQFETHPDSLRVWNYNVSPATRVPNTDATNVYATFTGYMWRKWTDPKDRTDDENCEGDIVLFRYAELLLTYAEAKIEANQIDESVYKALDSVRLRAGMPAVPRAQTQAYLRSLVRRERKVELANEGHRLFDIRRWKIAEKTMKGPRYGRSRTTWLTSAPAIDENSTPDYSNVSNAGVMRVIENMVFNPNRDYLWPIPNIEVQTTKGAIRQNDNW
ncbi:RagB/SusD family nutrient uptake outer membrane protein [Longitalea arenae]|uniref:RagB/SusD family nutrient uptake outer membrane protein n=1 Tax=Longitalea arenae TaxID=2812558 RepID=UPI0019672DB9|nr:RagB/SusD family nutrient uptake outer membrane protein [Longitalea arenae]